MREIRTTIDIEASPGEVWDVLMDFQNYDEWNPFIRSIDGVVVPGETLDVVLGARGKKPMRFTPTVTDCEKASHFSWLGSIGIKGLFDGHHRFELVPIDGGTRFVHREEFSGLLGPVVLRSIRTSTTRGFEEMNRALKEKVEQLDGAEGS